MIAEKLTLELEELKQQMHFPQSTHILKRLINKGFKPNDINVVIWKKSKIIFSSYVPGVITNSPMNAVDDVVMILFTPKYLKSSPIPYQRVLVDERNSYEPIMPIT